MKTLKLLILCLAINFGSYAQTAFVDYVDGKIYMRVNANKNPGFEKTQKNWSNLPIAKFPFLSGLTTKYGITQISKPFFAAKGSDVLLRTYIVEFTQFADVQNLIEDLKTTGAVELSERVPLTKTCVTPYTPNDYSASQQWALAKINATTAWGYYHANSTTATVAVVDNAMQITHPDLSANIWVNPNEIASNGIDDDGNGYIDDVNGYDVADNDNNPLPPNTTFDHGTHCTGIIGARNDNGTGISSIGFNIKVIPVKSTHNAGTAGNIDAGYAGIIYAVSVHARVISCSWGGTGSAAATEQSVINYAWQNNCIVVCAAGNDNNSTLHYPAAYNNVYCVASTTSSDTRSSFSCYGSWVDIAAPGSGIYSTVPNNSYANMSGTSMATPLVAGLCGLMIAYQPYLTPTQVINCINTTALSMTGQMGHGRIDAGAAMACVSTATLSGPSVDFVSDIILTCPHSPVKFFDKSFYGATSWSWTFTGGTPATSTAQNPTVTYAAAGTYQVQLTATNPNGSATKTKTSYITVAGPTTLPLLEGFTAATYPPAGWSEYDIALDSVKWYRNTTVGGFGTSSQCVFFDNYNTDATGKNDQLRTPKYDFTGLTSASLKFDVAYEPYNASFSDSLKVLVSTDCGATYTSVYLKGGTTLATAPADTTQQFVPTSTQWRTETVNLTSFVGQGNVMVVFENHGHYGQALYVDNINISGVTSGAAPTALFTLGSNVCSGQTFALTDQSSNNPTSWSWTMTGATPATSTAQNPSVSYAAGGSYTVTLVATNSFGSSAPISQTVTINATPIATAGTSGGPFCTAGAINLTSSGGGTYSWAGPGSYTSTLQNPTRSPATFGMAGTYTVTVNNSGCTSTATTVVAINAKPTANLTSSGSTFCAGGSTTLNAGTSTAGSGTITGYQWQMSGTPIGGATASTYTATAAGTYNVIVTNSNGCSSTSTTNTVVVNNGPATPTVTQNGLMLTSSSATGNQWYFNGTLMPGETNQTLTVTQNGNYTVVVTDVNSCTASSLSFNVGNVGITENNIVTGLTIYPNPNNGVFELSMNLPDKATSITITNVLGQTIFSESIKNGGGKYTKSFNIAEYGPGMYFISISNGKNKTTKKIIVD